MQDIIINPYTQVLLAGIGTSLVTAIGALWVIIWRLVKDKDTLYEKNQTRYEALVDRYHAFATSMERMVERATKE